MTGENRCIIIITNILTDGTALKSITGLKLIVYKLIHFYDDIDAWELYDLESDPQEVENL